jgi:hypothetical protein
MICSRGVVPQSPRIFRPILFLCTSLLLPLLAQLRPAPRGRDTVIERKNRASNAKMLAALRATTAAPKQRLLGALGMAAPAMPQLQQTRELLAVKAALRPLTSPVSLASIPSCLTGFSSRCKARTQSWRREDFDECVSPRV